MARVSFEFKKGDLAWVSLVVILISVGFVYAAWDDNKAMFHDDADVKVYFNGSERSLSEALSIIEAGGGFGGAGGGMSFGEWEDVTSVSRTGAVQGPVASDGFVILVAWITGGSPVHGYVGDGSSLGANDLKIVGNYPNPGNPEGLMMPVKKGQYWKVVNANNYGTPKIHWLPLVSSAGLSCHTVTNTGDDYTSEVQCDFGTAVGGGCSRTNSQLNCFNSPFQEDNPLNNGWRCAAPECYGRDVISHVICCE